MKFLVDAHLPPTLCEILQAAGHDALHTTGLPAQNKTPDRVINELSVTDQRVVISKDTDFYYSHVLHQRPWKLLLVRTGNIRTRELERVVQIDARLKRPEDFRDIVVAMGGVFDKARLVALALP